MITLEQAKNLKVGQILYHMTNRNADGSPQRWKVNGKVKLWKRDPNRILVPIKHGLRSYGYLDEAVFHLLSLIESETKYFKKRCLNILTPNGDHYKIKKNGNIVRIEMDTEGFDGSETWQFLGLSHVKRNEFIPFKNITEDFLKDFNSCWKNGNPQYTVRDLDHGTKREWGNIKYHGVKKIWFD